MKSTDVPKLFSGTWRITWMEQWATDVIDLDGEARFEFTESGDTFQFICVHGFMDCRYSVADGVPRVDFSWDGNDESDPASGRGVATIEDGKLIGHIFLHQGDDSEFEAKRKGARAKTSAPKSARKAKKA